MSTKSLLLATSLFGVALGLPAVALAQAAPAASNDTTNVDELVVTGSRIPRLNLDQPTPVTTATARLLENAGTSNLGDVIAQLPALSSAGTARANGNSFGDVGGLNFPDLRALGTSRTLTLVDGRRHVSGDAGDSAVDLNSIPKALVDRVEVVTGGASAIYGSDAVSGVINIITKKHFNGVELELEGGQPDRGDYGRNTSASITVGHDFDQGRANFTASAFWDQTRGVKAADIRSLKNYGTIVNSDPFDGQPDRILKPYVVSEVIDENSVLLDPDTFGAVVGFTNAGVPVTQPSRLADNSFAFGQLAGPCGTCFQLEDWLLLVAPTQRRGLAGSFNYQVTPNINFYTDAKFVQTKVADYVQPSFFFGDFQLNLDNPFITPAIQSAISGLSDAPFISRFLGDLGARTNSITRETWRYVAGFNGKFDPGFAEVSWDLSYNRGQTRNLIISQNNVVPGNFAAAIDAVRDPASGQIRCRVDVPSLQDPGYSAPSGMTQDACVPYNVFGQQNSAAAINYVRHGAARTHRIDQEVVSGSFNFDTGRFLNLPGGAIGFAGGFEYRKEDSQNINDPFVKAGLSDTAPQPDASGGFDVKEVFAETTLPILRDKPFVYELTLDAAIRYADYSTVGGATAWKAGLVYAPFKDIKFRATYSEAVRAPNITEAFLPATAGFFSVVDPCDVNEVGRDPDRKANCATLGIPAGFVSNTNASIQGTSSGNADLNAEKATSTTVGVVLQPRWTPGLSLTVDYYNIHITDAITSIDAQDIINNCVDAGGGPDQSFCNLFTRDATGNIDFVKSTYLNAAARDTIGWDISLAYTTQLAGLTRDLGPLRFFDGRMDASITANHLDKLRLFAFQDRPDEQDILEHTIGDPEWKVLSNLSYRQGRVQVDWKSRFLSKVDRYNRKPTRDGSESISPSKIEPVWYHDATIRYELSEVGRGAEIYLGVNNIFDEEPPLGVVQGDGTDASYDLLGRYVFTGVRLKF